MCRTERAETQHTAAQKASPQEQGTQEKTTDGQMGVTSEKTARKPDAVNESLHKLELRAPRISPELRGLPIDHPEMVHREPARFGTIRVDRDDPVTHIYLHRIPTALTANEKQYMFRT